MPEGQVGFVRRAEIPSVLNNDRFRQLTRKAGADVAVISDKLGWQTHTTRAALTGLRRAGYEVVGEKQGEGKPKRYRISAMPAKVGETALAEATDAR
ncbi:MAG: DUF3489 domain-containing protein [Pseudomonadota bacterium]